MALPLLNNTIIVHHHHPSPSNLSSSSFHPFISHPRDPVLLSILPWEPRSFAPNAASMNDSYPSTPSYFITIDSPIQTPTQDAVGHWHRDRNQNVANRENLQSPLSQIPSFALQNLGVLFSPFPRIPSRLPSKTLGVFFLFILSASFFHLHLLRPTSAPITLCNCLGLRIKAH